jgi:chaperonin cofactor prefoldin
VDNSKLIAESSYRQAENLEKKISPLTDQISAISQSYEAMTKAVTTGQTETTQIQTTLLSSISGLETKLKDIEANQERLKTKISGYEEQIQKLSLSPPAPQK